MVFPNGTLARNRWPFGAQPRNGAMLVLSLSKDGPGLVDEHQSARINPALIGFPPSALVGHVRATLLAGQHGFF
jgi:hypothetical protein